MLTFLEWQRTSSALILQSFDKFQTDFRHSRSPPPLALAGADRFSSPVTGRVSFRIVLFSPLNWAVDELEKSKLACLCDSNSPAGELVFLHLSGRQKSGGFRVFSNGDTECSSNGDEVGSW